MSKCNQELEKARCSYALYKKILIGLIVLTVTLLSLNIIECCESYAIELRLAASISLAVTGYVSIFPFLDKKFAYLRCLRKDARRF